MTQPQTLREGLAAYYGANPNFVRDRDLQLGWLSVPWCDLQRHDIMHIVTGYSATLKDEMHLVGFLLTALTWRRPWRYYLQSIGTALEITGRACWRQPVGDEPMTHSPLEIVRFYLMGVRQGLTVRQRIRADIDPATVMDQSLESLRQQYGIANAGAWDRLETLSSQDSTVL